MARNKYPQETIQKIVETSARLFLEQGYENTSIQDIINNLGGLSKGAIYHHFPCKEDILYAVMEYFYHDSEQIAMSVLQDPTLNGLQRLRKMLESSVHASGQEKAFALSIDMLKNPKMLTMQLQSSVYEVAHQLVLPVLEEGMRDGSITGLAYPRQFAEAIMILSNIWANPMIFPASPEEIEQRLHFLQYTIRAWGIQEEVISEQVVESMKQYTALHIGKQQG